MFIIVQLNYFIRQTKWNLNQSGVTISHTGTIVDHKNYRLDETAFLGKNWNSHGFRSDQIGGRLDYSHKPSGSSAFVGADNSRGYGTDVIKYQINHQIQYSPWQELRS